MKLLVMMRTVPLHLKETRPVTVSNSLSTRKQNFRLARASTNALRDWLVLQCRSKLFYRLL